MKRIEQANAGGPCGAWGAWGTLRTWAALIFAVAAGLRVWSIVALSRDPHIADPILDSRHYLDLAARLARGEGWPAGPHFFGPLYPFLLGRLFSLVKPSVLSVQIAQSIGGLLAMAMLMAAVRRRFGPAAALVAGALLALYGPILAMESQALMESALLLFACAALWLWPAAGRRPAAYAGFGLACGLLAAGRASFLLLPLIAIAGWAAGALRGGHDGRERSGGRTLSEKVRALGLPVLLMAAATALPLIPQTVAQTRATGHLQVMTLNGGMNLYVGNNPAARGIFSEPPELDLNDDLTGARSAAVLANQPLDLEASSRFWRDRALGFMRERPGRARWLLGRKAVLFLSPQEIPQVNDFQILADAALPLRAAFLRFGLVLPFAILGVFCALRGSRALGSSPAAARMPRKATASRAVLFPWLAMIAVAWIQTIVFFATGRYRIPVMPAFLGLAAAGIAWAGAGIASAQRKGALTILAAALAAGVGLQLLPPAYPAAKARAFDAFQMGVRYMRAGRTHEALRSYEKAIAQAPASGEAWHGKATALYHQRRLPEAIEAYQEALRRMPQSAITWYALGLAFRDGGAREEAARALQAAVGLNDRNIAYRLELGDALDALGRKDEAVAQWQAILEIQPGQPDAVERLRVAASR